MNQFDETCRPVIFAYEHAAFSYWGKGSSFLLATSNSYFWVTASHVLSNSRADVHSLRIFPSDQSQVSLPFNEKYAIKLGLTDDEDYKDLLVLRINLEEFDSFGDAPIVAQDIDRGVLSAEDLKPGDELWVIGYPAESNFIDYDSRTIKNTRSVLGAVYKGRSAAEHCHELKIESSIRLDSFDGLSGGPVFHMKSSVDSGEPVLYPLLVGMLVRGTASSATVHLVSSSVIVSLVNLAEQNA